MCSFWMKAYNYLNNELKTLIKGNKRVNQRKIKEITYFLQKIPFWINPGYIQNDDNYGIRTIFLLFKEGKTLGLILDQARIISKAFFSLSSFTLCKSSPFFTNPLNSVLHTMSKRDLRKAPIHGKEQTKGPRMTSINYRELYNSIVLHKYNNIFSKKKIFIERFMKQTTL